MNSIKWNVCSCKTLTRASFFSYNFKKALKNYDNKSEHDWIFMDVSLLYKIGISFGDWCNIKWNAWRKTEVGFSNVWCRWKWCNRYSGNDKNSPGMIETLDNILIFLIVLLDFFFYLLQFSSFFCHSINCVVYPF